MRDTDGLRAAGTASLLEAKYEMRASHVAELEVEVERAGFWKTALLLSLWHRSNFIAEMTRYLLCCIYFAVFTLQYLLPSVVSG